MAIETRFDIGTKLCEKGFDRGSELEAYMGSKVEGHDDLLDVGIVKGVEVVVTMEPSSDAPVGNYDATYLPAGM